MRCLLALLLFGVFVAAGLSQTQKPKASTTKPKPTPTKAKATAKPKATPAKAKTTAAKPKPTPAKTKTTAAKPKATPEKTKAAAAKPKPTATPEKISTEKPDWEAAIALTARDERLAALEKFNETFPRSKQRAEALAMISSIHAEIGNEKLAAGETEAAATAFKAAASSAPRPLPDALFETLSKVPANLYFRGFRGEALEIAKNLEAKATKSAAQLLNIATFYLSIESGSDAKRLADKAIALDAKSSAAYQTLGLANRMDFLFEESATAYAKALELEPESMTARRGLAELKRALGKADDAVTLYREILAKDEANLPARTGLILSLFDSGKRADAEAELAKSLETNPGNVILLASAAYWYAVQNEGEKAVEYAQKAVAHDPRFIWSHIALARGLLAQNKAAEAERALLAARRYGNFPTIGYELATARLAAGFFRDAADELAKRFTVKDGVITTKLGGRVARGSKYFTELVGLERRASIFAPTAADNAENAARLAALLEFRQALDAKKPDPKAIEIAADEFIKGDDKMKVHRQIFVASQLADKKVSLAKAVELAKAAAANIDAGLDITAPGSAVMASELYEPRAIADARGQSIEVPEVPRAVLLAIMRGRLDDIAGWAQYQMDAGEEAVASLRRAVTVLPADSAWWRSSMWRLGTALALTGKDAEALDAYIKAYRNQGSPDPIRYVVVESLYKKVNGKTDGLEALIGTNPGVTVVASAEPAPTPDVKESPKAEPSPTPTPTAETSPTPVPEASPTPSPTPAPKEVAGETNPPDKSKELFPPVIITIPARENPKPEPAPTPTPEPAKCTITVSEDSVTLNTGGGDLAVIVGLESDGDLDGIKATSSSPQDLTVRQEPIAGVKARALFVLRAISSKAGVYQVTFELPCGKKTITSKVR
jgi:tetratricopeptide (TPR) repeat protein